MEIQSKDKRLAKIKYVIQLYAVYNRLSWESKTQPVWKWKNGQRYSMQRVTKREEGWLYQYQTKGLLNQKSYKTKTLCINISFNTVRICNSYKHLCAKWQIGKIYKAKTDRIKGRKFYNNKNFNTPLSVMDRTIRQCSNKEIEDLSQ